MDITPPQLPDDIAKPVEDLASQTESAADAVSGLADNLVQGIEGQLESAGDKLDGFINGLDNFLGKF